MSRKAKGMDFSSLAERQILKGQLEGQLEGLEGEGKPLPDQPSYDSEAIGFRIMAEAGTIPREIELKKAIDAQFAVVNAAINTPNYQPEMRKLADLQLRHAIEQEARKKFFRTP